MSETNFESGGLWRKTRKAILAFWEFLKADTWPSFVVSLILLLVLIKFVIFPGLSFVTGSELPLVVIESCSLHHDSDFDTWWGKYSGQYEQFNIGREEFESFPFRGGLNKGDIIFVWGRSEYNVGDIIIFEPNPESTAPYPIIHRIVYSEPFGTKGDNGLTNPRQLDGNNEKGTDETEISEDRILGKASFRVPLIGWLKLVFFEYSKSPSERGFC